VIRLSRHARGILVAVAVLALGAGNALAAHADPSTGSMPDAARPGLDGAAEASGKAVPVAAAAGADRRPDAAPTTNTSDEDADAEAPAAPDAAADHPDNHGATVSAAARGATPQAFSNHGAYVRSIAKANHGQEVSAGKRPDVSKQGTPTH